MNYTINFDEKLCVERWADQWVLRWCKKYHPEAFTEGEKYVRDLIKNENNKNKEKLTFKEDLNDKNRNY